MMFKKATVLALAASLGGCAGTGFNSTTLQNDIAAIEQQVQQDTNLACGFIPTVSTIAALIPGATAGAAMAGQIATAICTAISNAPVVKPAAMSMRARLAASGADIQVTTMKTPNGPVAVVGHFTR